MGSPISKAKKNISNEEYRTARIHIDDDDCDDADVYGYYHPDHDKSDQIEISSSSSSEKEKATNQEQHQNYHFYETSRLPQHRDTRNTSTLQSPKIASWRKKSNPTIEISSSSSSSLSSPRRRRFSFINEDIQSQGKQSSLSSSLLSSSSSFLSCYNNCDSYILDDDVAEFEKEEIYDWLKTNNSRRFNSVTSSATTTANGCKSPILNQSFSSSFSPQQHSKHILHSSKLKEKMTFSPPGWDSPLHQEDDPHYSSFSSNDEEYNNNEIHDLRSSVVGNSNNINNKEKNGKSRRSDQLVVKDTYKVRRKNAQLPKKKPDVVAKGNWLTNRYVVNNYIILHCIGSGSYGEVRLCKDKHSNNLFAIKVINRAKTQDEKNIKIKSKQNSYLPEALDDLRMEVAIMKKLRHENCVSLYEVMDDPSVNKLYLVMEYMKRGDLMQLMDADDKHMDDNDVWDILRQIIRGLKYLHDNNIIHGDLKPQNLLVSPDGFIKIGDFGLSKMIDENNELQKGFVGTPAFMAPEVCVGESFNGKVADLYSVGATTYYIRFRKPPFIGRNLMELYARIKHDQVHFPFSVAEGLEEIMSGLMVKVPSQRLTMTELLVFPWLQQRPGENNNCNNQADQLSRKYGKVHVSGSEIYNSIKYLDKR